MISVITPCFNIVKDGREEYFHKMMKSVHEQTYKDIEHIFIDGGSKDGTLEILKQYQDKGWINTLVSEKDSGIYEAMNKGIRLAKGDYIHIMNTDDYFIDLNFFNDSLLKIENNNVDFSHADKIIKSRNGKPDTIKKGDERVAFFRMPFRHQTMIIKKEVFDQIGLFDEKYKIASDYKFVLKMLFADLKGIYIPKVYVCSLDGGVSSDRFKCIEEVSSVLRESYGKDYRLSLENCKMIYLRKISLPLLLKIVFRVKDTRIKKSLFYCFKQNLFA